ncbi:MAG: hypothetical protein ACE5ER_02045 [Nitrospinaceae bacterium]
MKRWSLLAILASLFIPPHAIAQDGLAVGLRASTLGSGLELTLPMSQHFNLRGQGNGFAYSHTLNEANLSYDADLRLLTVGGILDFHPFAGSFRLSAGAFYNGNELELKAKPAGNSFNINGRTFTLSQAGSVTGEVTFNDVSPYVGIGWGNPVRKGSKWGFQFELGALYQGVPNVTLTASGAVASLASNIAAEQAALQNALNDPLFRWYPVISLAISYRV